MYLSRKDLEKIAQDAYTAYLQLPKVRLKSEVVKVDPMIVAENLLNLRVDFQHLSEDKLTFGVTSYVPTTVPILDDDSNMNLYPLDGRTVLIETDIAADNNMPGKFNFTLMHESCHHILRRLFPNDYGIQMQKDATTHFYRYEGKRTIDNWEEWQASALASAVLLPEELFSEGFYEILQSCQYDGLITAGTSYQNAATGSDRQG